MYQFILSSQWVVLFLSIVCINLFCHLSGLYCFCPLYVSIYFVISVGCIVFVHCMYQFILSSQWVVLFLSIVCINLFCHLSGLYCFCPLYVSIYFVISVGCIVFVHCMYQFILSSQWVVLFLSIVCINLFCHLSGLYCFCPLYVSIYFVVSVDCIVFVHCMYEFIFKENKNLMGKIESNHYQTALAVTSAWKRTNTDKIYHELGLEPLTERRRFRRLVQCFKIQNDLIPEYLMITNVYPRTHLYGNPCCIFKYSPLWYPQWK